MMEQKTAHIIEKCRKGNRSAQWTLYNRYAGKLYAVCLYLIGHKEEAEEAMQDAFLKIFSGLDRLWLDKLPDNEPQYEAWMRKIAVHTAIDYLRKKELVWEEIPENYAEMETGEEDREEEVALSIARIKENILRLPDGYRVVLSLYLFDGYDMEEIASILHLQPASVRSQYLRAKRKLLNLIKNEQENG